MLISCVLCVCTVCWWCRLEWYRMDVSSYLIALSKLPAPIAVKQMECCWAGCCLRHPPTHPFNGPLLWTIRVSRYQKGKSNLDFIEARDSEWQRHQLSHMQVCTSLQKDNHAAPHHSVFYRPDALPVTQPTASKHWRHNTEGSGTHLSCNCGWDKC